MQDVDLKSLDELEQSKMLIKGLCDVMYYMETAKQDKLIPVAILCPFEAVLERVYLLIEEIEERERKNDEEKSI